MLDTCKEYMDESNIVLVLKKGENKHIKPWPLEDGNRTSVVLSNIKDNINWSASDTAKI